MKWIKEDSPSGIELFGVVAAIFALLMLIGVIEFLKLIYY